MNASRPSCLLACFCLVVGGLSIALPSYSYGQVALPTATPSSTVAPDPAPSPSTTPAGTPSPTPVVDLDAYRQALTPAVSVVLTAASSKAGLPPQGGQNKVLNSTLASAGNAATVTIQPQPINGALGEINLGVLTGTQPLPPATVTLQYPASNAGTLLWVQTLDGGTLQAQDADGKTVTAPGGFWMEISATGQVNFTFQAPARSSVFRVLTRLSNVSTVLPFVIPDPSQDN